MGNDFNVEEVYEEIKAKAFGNGTFSRDDWNLLVEETLADKMDSAELDDREAWLDIQEAIKNRYEDFAIEIEDI